MSSDRDQAFKKTFGQDTGPVPETEMLITLNTAIDKALGGDDRAWAFCCDKSRPLISYKWWLKQCRDHRESKAGDGFALPKNAKVPPVLPVSVAVPLVREKLISVSETELESLGTILQELAHVRALV